MDTRQKRGERNEQLRHRKIEQISGFAYNFFLLAFFLKAQDFTLHTQRLDIVL